ncbi:hypothetical protein B0H17DRAFT_1137310 [Mycena rosella]|uniref:Uncharacterized protein n=1 Tax=Mycena rosella TaxID=1033263 RepID=A0AAD7D997_MYCRO|nr:hypothetical protein B0H17DRAFT_1137310 [Mycena rosella]
MDDFNGFCADIGPDGKRCICRRCVLKAKRDEDDPDICKICNHMESAHPPAAGPRIDITSFAEDLREKGKVKAGSSSSSKLKASVSDAEAETSSGLRPQKRKLVSSSRTDTEPSEPKRLKAEDSSKALKKICGKKVEVQKLIFLPDGLNSQGKLNRTSISSAYLDLLLHAKLAKLSTPTKPLIFYPGDTNQDACTFVKHHFPEATSFLQENPYKPEAHQSNAMRNQLWRLYIKDNRKIMLSAEPFPSGAEMQNVGAPAGRPIAQRTLILTSKRRIPQERYNDWDAEFDPMSSDYEVEGDEEEDELDSLKQKGKGKQAMQDQVCPPEFPPNAGALYVADSDEEEMPESLISGPLAAVSGASNSEGAASSTSSAAAPGQSDLAASSSSTAPVTTPLNAAASSSAIIPSTTHSPLFSSFATPSPPSGADDDIFTFGDTWRSRSPEVSPMNSCWAAAVASVANSVGSNSAASSSSVAGGFPTSMRNTRPSPWV